MLLPQVAQMQMPMLLHGERLRGGMCAKLKQCMCQGEHARDCEVAVMGEGLDLHGTAL